MTPQLTFEKLLKESGNRVTQPRRHLFEFLLKAGRPMPMREIIEKNVQTLDRVSVYRTVDLFEKLGIAHRIHSGWKYRIELTDVFIDHHHHMSCLECGTSVDITDEKHIDEFIHRVAKDEGFEPIRHVFEVEGYCKKCASSAQT